MNLNQKNSFLIREIMNMKKHLGNKDLLLNDIMWKLCNIRVLLNIAVLFACLITKVLLICSMINMKTLKCHKIYLHLLLKTQDIWAIITSLNKWRQNNPIFLSYLELWEEKHFDQLACRGVTTALHKRDILISVDLRIVTAVGNRHLTLKRFDRLLLL